MRIVIGDGLTRAHLSPERQFQGLPANLGATEIGRLMGRGRAYGHGPLPALLRNAMDADKSGSGVILLREAPDSGEGASTSEGAEVMSAWVDPVEEVVQHATVVECPEGQIAWRNLLAAIASVSGVPLSEVEQGTDRLSFLVVGTHTEKRTHCWVSETSP
jgi:hypothetical protein